MKLPTPDRAEGDDVKRTALALLTASLVAISCTSTPAASTPAVSSAAAAAATSAAPSPTPCARVYVSPKPAASGTPAPTLAPEVSANTDTTDCVRKILDTPVAGKTASIDILEVDQATHLLYVADRTDSGVDVLDVSSPTAKYLTTIATGSGPNGLVVAKDVNKLFAGLNDSNVAIIDITPGAATKNTVIAKLNTGGKGRADELDYDSKDKKVYAANSDDGIVTVIDATTNTIIKKFENMGDGLEQPRYDPKDGMVYMTSSAQNAIFQFDPTKDTMVKKFDVGTPCDPNGIGINPTTNHALLGCSNKKANVTLEWDLTAGKVVQTFDQAGAGDAVIYDAKADRFIFGASNFNRGPVMAIFTGDPIKFVTNVPTATGAHGVAFDETNNIIYTGDQNPNEGGLFAIPLPKR